MTPIPNGSTPSAEPQGRNPEQTTGAAVGGVSATIPDDVLDAAHAIRERIEGWSGGQTASIIARAIIAAQSAQREKDMEMIWDGEWKVTPMPTDITSRRPDYIWGYAQTTILSDLIEAISNQIPEPLARIRTDALSSGAATRKDAGPEAPEAHAPDPQAIAGADLCPRDTPASQSKAAENDSCLHVQCGYGTSSAGTEVDADRQPIHGGDE